MIPTASNYPVAFDTDTNLFTVHDGLRMTLADDYNPGDISIVVEGDLTIMSKFPSTGIITLTDQCADIEKRAIDFFYGSKTNYTFDDLEILPGCEDVVKPKEFTHVTLNVVAHHHNHIKDAVIAIEDFVGAKGTVDTEPLGPTLEGRINFLRRLVFSPRTWFKVIGNRVGLAPLNVVFINESFRLGPGDITFLWDFGDQTVSVMSTISLISCVGLAECCWNVPDCQTISKSYINPGIYTVQLTASNMYSSDTVVFEDLIHVRMECPDEAVIDFIPKANQIITAGEPTGGPYTTSPTIRSPVDTFIDVEIPSGINPVTGKTYGGEVVDGTNTPLDPIMTYTWSFDDDMSHENQTSARAMYHMGGKFDLKLRTDTNLGAYRITNYKEAIDIVESKNLWLWTYEGSSILSGYINTNEFGLLSETFKTAINQALVVRNDAFLESDQWEEIEDPSSGYDVIVHAKKEFEKNTAFTSVGTTASGNGGSCLLFYAGGGAKNTSLTDQELKLIEHNGFSDSYDLGHEAIVRPWNWVHLGGLTKSYFIMGQNPTTLPMTNPSYQIKTSYNLSTFSSTNTTLSMDNYKNGANELTQHVSSYNSSGYPINGWFATYRSAWKNNTGYFLRNDGIGSFFRIKSFYKTEGTILEDFINIKKLPDMDGPAKLEGQLVPLTNGIFFFSNSGNISAYNDTTGTWETGGPSIDSVSFSTVQDNTVANFSNAANTLLAASDGDYTAYLSFDYSNNAFIKFNGHDLTFNVIRSRPNGSQFTMGVY